MNEPDFENFRQARAQRSDVREDRQRVEISILCEVRQGITEWRIVRLSELSPGGFRIHRFGEADPNQPLRIRIPGLQILSAKIVWQKDGALGCAFATPLHEAVFAHITRSLGR